MGDFENPIEATAVSTNPDQLPSEDLSMDQLGRQRPKIFKNAFQEVGFCASIFISAILAEFLISGFPVLLPNIIDSLSIDPNKRTWPANVFSLVTGAFLLPCGRLADIHGGYIVFVSGLTWMGIWSIITGFSQNYIMLVFCRALQGIGAAAFLPSGLMLLSSSYRPGPRKNVVFSLYGAAAPVGFFFGILIAGVTAEFLNWAWFFWVGAIMLGIIVVMSWLCIPHHYPKTGAGMDWWGCGTSVLALVLLVYGITDSAHVEGRWRSPQILSTVILGVLVLAVFVYLEGWVVKNPLLSLSLFKPKHMKALMLCLFLCYGSFGIYLFYASFYIETVLLKSPVLTASWFAPLAAGGILIGTFGGLILHRIPGTLLMLLAATGFLVCSLLFAIIPDNPNYWAWIFPAMVCATIGIDIMYNVSNIFITSNVPKSQQGLAGACINTLLFLGMSFCLGFADYGVSQNTHSGLRESYKLGFWVGVGCAAVGVLVIIGGIRIGRAKSDLTLEEKEELRDGDAAGREPQVIPSHGNS